MYRVSPWKIFCGKLNCKTFVLRGPRSSFVKHKVKCWKFIPVPRKWMELN